MRAENRREQEILARELAASFAGLYTAAPHDDKKLLRETMTALQKVYDLLKRQWEELEQSPENGLQVLRELKAHGRYGKIPVVFYSRKITPEDVLRVLEAGAVDAIRKRYPGDDPRAQRDWVLQRLDRAQHVHRLLPAYHLNVNTTLFPA
jgi:DNA-binding NtrC family response regulator